MKKNKVFISLVASVVMSATILPTNVCADWQTKNNQTYYLDESGNKLIGWQTIDGKKYYFLSKGEMKTGWLTMKSGKKYYFKKDGSMVVGWLKIGDKQYYFDKDGVMAKGYARVGQKVYAFYDDGTLAYQCKDCLTYAGGKWYYLDKNGNFKTGMQTVYFDDGSTATFYFDKNGYAVTTTKIINGTTYEFDETLGLVDSYIGAKVGTFKSKYLKLSDFKVKNKVGSKKTEVKYSGSLKNTSKTTIKFYIYASLYDKDGNLMKNSQLISCNKLKPGETFKFDDSTYTDDITYKIEFTDIKIYSA